MSKNSIKFLRIGIERVLIGCLFFGFTSPSLVFSQTGFNRGNLPTEIRIEYLDNRNDVPSSSRTETRWLRAPLDFGTDGYRPEVQTGSGFNAVVIFRAVIANDPSHRLAIDEARYGLLESGEPIQEGSCQYRMEIDAHGNSEWIGIPCASAPQAALASTRLLFKMSGRPDSTNWSDVQTLHNILRQDWTQRRSSRDYGENLRATFSAVLYQKLHTIFPDAQRNSIPNREREVSAEVTRARQEVVQNANPAPAGAPPAVNCDLGAYAAHLSRLQNIDFTYWTPLASELEFPLENYTTTVNSLAQIDDLCLAELNRRELTAAAETQRGAERGATDAGPADLSRVRLSLPSCEADVTRFIERGTNPDLRTQAFISTYEGDLARSRTLGVERAREALGRHLRGPRAVAGELAATVSAQFAQGRRSAIVSVQNFLDAVTEHLSLIEGVNQAIALRARMRLRTPFSRITNRDLKFPLSNAEIQILGEALDRAYTAPLASRPAGTSWIPEDFRRPASVPGDRELAYSVAFGEVPIDPHWVEPILNSVHAQCATPSLASEFDRAFQGAVTHNFNVDFNRYFWPSLTTLIPSQIAWNSGPPTVGSSSDLESQAQVLSQENAMPWLNQNRVRNIVALMTRRSGSAGAPVVNR